MRTLLFTLPAALALSACIEVDMALEILGEDEARMTGTMQMQRQIYEMSGGDDSFCPEEDGGTLTLTDAHVTCTFDTTGTFDEIMQGEDADGSGMEMEGEIVALGDGRVRVSLPLGDMTEDLDEMQEDPQMMAFMQQMMSGMSVSFTVKGSEIESSTGTISEDRTSATITMGVDDFFAPAEDRLTVFETILRY